MLKFFCKIIKFLHINYMLKYIINFLIKICLINIFTIKIFPQNCCDICLENCKKILHKKKKKAVKKNNINNRLGLGRNNSKQKSNQKKDLGQDKNSVLKNANNNSLHSNNIPTSSYNSGSGNNNRSSHSRESFYNNTDSENKQEKYFNKLLENVDDNIKNFNDSIFSENPDSINVVKDGTQKNDWVLGEGSYGKESSLINAEPDVIKVIKKNAAFTSTEFDKSIINKLKDKGVTYAIFFDENKQKVFHSWQLSQNKKIHSNLINTISENADKQEILEEILCFYENEILYIENNPDFLDLKFN